MNVARKSKRYADSAGEVARHFRVNERTVNVWVKRSGFPRPTRRGWNLDKIDAWLLRNTLGPHREKHSAKPDALREAQRKRIQMQTEREVIKTERDRIARQREELELQQLFGQVLDAREVEAWHQRVVSLALSELDTLRDRVARELPEELDDALRARVIVAVERCKRNTVEAIRGLIAGEQD